MKTILILLASLLLTVGGLKRSESENLKYKFVNDQQKPFNTVNELTYNIDKSISLKFNSNTIINISPTEINIFIDHFRLADLLADYCSKNCRTDIVKSLGVYRDFEFIYLFKYNSIGGTSMLDVIYLKNDYSSYPIHINFIQVNNKFIDYLTTYRDKYYNDLKVYNDNLHNMNGSIDSLLKKN